MWNDNGKGTYLMCFFVEHERGNGPTGVGAGPSLSTNADGSMANAELVDGSRDSMKRGRHLV